MKLEELPPALGSHFLPGGGYRLTQRQLPRRWDYLLAAPSVAARFSQGGLVSLQVRPPAGRMLCETPGDSPVPPLVVWIHDGEGEPFTHVLSPISSASLLQTEEYQADYLPGEVVYRIAQRGWNVTTAFRIDPQHGALLGRVVVRNSEAVARKVRIVFAFAALNAPAARAPWDAVGLYQRTETFRLADGCAIAVENRNPEGDASRRVSMGVFVSRPDAQMLGDRPIFTGTGSWCLPEFALKAASGNSALCSHGVESVAAFAWDTTVGEGKAFDFSLAVAAMDDAGAAGVAQQHGTLLSPRAWEDAHDRIQAQSAKWESALEMHTPDGVLDDYVKHWLPRQLMWVSLLDRGWPTGLRGVRDAAQDFSAVAWIEPAWSRDVLLMLLAKQRSDGWFPRQIALPSSRGADDLRNYVDSGCWVVELLWDYVRLTGDKGILEEQSPWLDDAKPSTVAEHILQAVRYYTTNASRTPDRLVPILGGDWNDAVHLAGVHGRGESVMASCQTVLSLRQVAKILPDHAAELTKAADELRESIRSTAMTGEGFLRGVRTDDGRWIFSERDPDGQRRVNAAVQAWGIISGVVDRDASRRVLAMIAAERGPHGFRLFHPPMGDPPIPGVGRVASGDLMAGVAENGTVYNHGSQAFLARAAAVAGDGDLLLEILRWSLPCFADRHPVEVARTPPYAIVNCYMETPGHDGEGGSLFLSGTIGVLRRVIVEGLLGFQPGMDGIRIQPCLPQSWPWCRYAVRVRGETYNVSLGTTGEKSPALIPWSADERRILVNIGGAT